MTTPFGMELACNLLAAWAAGMLIGLERSYNGRAAGFRTHALVALAASAAVSLTLLPLWHPVAGTNGALLDPSRIDQGVLTGIGFLGAGVIFKEGVSVQGLTTAASIWATAVVGMMFGVGMISAGVGVTALILATLFLLRWLERVIPWPVYAMAVFRFEAARAPSEAELCRLLDGVAVSLDDVSYKLLNGGQIFEYWTNLKTRRSGALARLAVRLKTIPGLVEYEVSRINK